MKKTLNKTTLTKFFLTFLLIQSIIDLYFLASYDSIKLFGFSIPTLIRILGIGIIFLLLIFSSKNELKKSLPLIFSYILLIIIYFIFHHKNALNFKSLLPGNLHYNIIQEIFYIVRLLIPLFIIYVSYFVFIKEKDFNKLIYLILALVCGSIVFSNIFKIGLASYFGDPIKGNIIDWFLIDNYDMHHYATKGWFANANAISAMMVLLLPITLNNAIKSKENKWFGLLIIQMLAMLMIGTKVGAWGFILILITFLIMYLFFIFIRKEYAFDYRIFSKLMSLVIIFSFIYPYSPSKQRFEAEQERYNYSDATQKSVLEEFEKKLEQTPEEEKESFKINFIKNEYRDFSINPTFIEFSYSYNYDPDFWISIFYFPYVERTNYRFLETKMVERIKEVDNRKSNDFLGLTYSRLSKVFTLEKDFIFQNKTLGVIGLILLVIIYIIILIYIIIKMLFINKEQFNLKNSSILLGICVCFASAYMSGNIVDNLMVMILVGFLTGVNLKTINKKTNE